MIVRGESTIIDYQAPFDQGLKYTSEVLKAFLNLYTIYVYKGASDVRFWLELVTALFLPGFKVLPLYAGKVLKSTSRLKPRCIISERNNSI